MRAPDETSQIDPAPLEMRHLILQELWIATKYPDEQRENKGELTNHVETRFQTNSTENYLPVPPKARQSPNRELRVETSFISSYDRVSPKWLGIELDQTMVVHEPYGSFNLSTDQSIWDYSRLHVCTSNSLDE